MAINIILRLTLREASRRKVLRGLLILSAVFLVLYTLGLAFVQSEVAASSNPVPTSIGGVNTVYNFLLMAGLYAANFLIVMLAVLISVDTVAGEISSGTIQAIAVKPLARRDILIGKWLGFVVLLGMCTLLLVGGVMAVTKLITGYSAPNWLSGLGLMYLEALALLSVSLLGGTRLSTLANGVIGFGLFGLAFIGGWIGQIGEYINSPAAQMIGRATALLMPTEALWRRAMGEMAEGLNPFKFMFGSATPIDPGVGGYALIFSAVMVGLAVWSFQRRDL
jgi:Cu-processing system permease protein